MNDTKETQNCDLILKLISTSVVTEYLDGWTKAALSSLVLLKEMHNMAFVWLQEN